MKRNIVLALVHSIVAATFLMLPIFAHAQVSGDVNTGLTRLGSDANLNGSTGIFNPQDSVVTIIGKVVKILLFVSGAITVLFVIIGGFMYVTSAGNEEQATKGRKTVTYALIGIIIIILSYVIVTAVVNLVQNRTLF
jgi:hypothetical protein